MHWIAENKAWLFDGAAVAITVAIFSWWATRRRGSDPARSQRQSGGDGSFNVQAGGDIRIDRERKDE